jgi:hypothetical protein
MRISLARLAAISGLTFALFLPFVTVNKKVYADGLWMETFPPASIGNRDASLFVRVNPPVLVTGSDQNAYLQLRLFDAKTNQTIQWTTYYITITKGAATDAGPILTGLFTSQDGLLTLHVTPNQNPIQIYGNYDDVYGYQADPGGNVKVTGPLFLDGGLYHFHIKILGIDTAKGLLNDTLGPAFDSYLSVGDVSTKNISEAGQTYNSTLISYYDKASSFDLNPGTKTFSWQMPFDWNATRIKNAPSFLVHEEVRIPRDLKGIGDTNSFNASVNGHQLQPYQLFVDPLSYPNVVAVHYLLGKGTILQLANETLNNQKQMQFSLSPAAAVVENVTSGVWRAERTTILVNWSTNPFVAGKDTTVNLQFIDSQGTGQKIDGNIHYDLNVLDANGNVVVSRPGLLAKNGQDSQTVNFPTNAKYMVEAKITSIDYTSQPADTRPDTARGIVVVPEFPATTIIAMVGIGAAVILGQRWLTRKI